MVTGAGVGVATGGGVGVVTGGREFDLTTVVPRDSGGVESLPEGITRLKTRRTKKPP